MATYWSPLVHCRTHKVDFRVIAAPEDLSHAEIEHLMVYVRASTSRPGLLFKNYRFVLVKDFELQCCLIGVTCPAKALSPEEMNADEKERPIYGFFGWVGKTLNPNQLPQLRIENFTSLYQYVRNDWNVKPYDSRWRQPHQVAYQSPIWDAMDTIDNIDPLNLIPDRCLVYPEQYAKELWWKAAATPKNIALCTGLQDISSASKLPFHVVSVLEFPENKAQPLSIQKEPTKTEPKLPSKAESRERDHSPAVAPHQTESIERPDFLEEGLKRVRNFGLNLIKGLSKGLDDLTEQTEPEPTKPPEKKYNPINTPTTRTTSTEQNEQSPSWFTYADSLSDKVAEPSKSVPENVHPEADQTENVALPNLHQSSDTPFESDEITTRAIDSDSGQSEIGPIYEQDNFNDQQETSQSFNYMKHLKKAGNEAKTDREDEEL